MAFVRTITFLLLVVSSASAQPFTKNDLWWPTITTNKPSTTPESPPIAYASFYVIPRDSGIANYTNLGTCATSTNLTIYPLLTGPLPFNGVASDVGEFADFSLGFNWVYDVSTYTPNAGFVGDDFYSYIVTNNISPNHLSDSKELTFIVYDTNSPSSSCSSSLVTSNKTILIRLPFGISGYNQMVSVYEIGCFTNNYTWNLTFNRWDGPPSIVGNAALFTIPCDGNICVSYTNSPIPPTNYCGGTVTDNITNVTWSFNGSGPVSVSRTSAANGIMTMTVTLCSQFSGAAGEAHYSICGSATNRTVHVTGLVTNIAQGGGDRFNISVNFVSKTNFPAVFGNTPVVYPIDFTYDLTSQATNTPEIEFVLKKNTSTLFPNNCDSMSGILTNILQ